MRALVRGLPASYLRATRGVLEPAVAPIDVALAREQHAAYVAALEGLGARVTVIPTSEPHPDCVFVEDTAVVSAGRAVVLRSAHPGRRGEASAVAAALRAEGLEVVALDAGTCDGGDVLVLEDRVLAGRSARTSDAGIAALSRALGREVTPVPLPAGVLHLKCVCSSPAPGVVVLAEGTVAPRWFGGARVVAVPAEEAYAANTVGHAGRVLVPAGYPRTARAIAEAGLKPVPIEVSEIRKGDGSLTCLSLRWPS